MAHPSKQENDSEEEKGGGFAEGYGLVDTAELSALLAADEEFNANLDLARISTEDELNRCALCCSSKLMIGRKVFEYLDLEW